MLSILSFVAGASLIVLGGLPEGQLRPHCAPGGLCGEQRIQLRGIDEVTIEVNITGDATCVPTEEDIALSAARPFAESKIRVVRYSYPILAIDVTAHRTAFPDSEAMSMCSVAWKWELGTYGLGSPFHKMQNTAPMIGEFVLVQRGRPDGVPHIASIYLFDLLAGGPVHTFAGEDTIAEHKRALLDAVEGVAKDVSTRITLANQGRGVVPGAKLNEALRGLREIQVYVPELEVPAMACNVRKDSLMRAAVGALDTAGIRVVDSGSVTALVQVGVLRTPAGECAASLSLQVVVPGAHVFLPYEAGHAAASVHLHSVATTMTGSAPGFGSQVAEWVRFQAAQFALRVILANQK